jgi:plasmid stabilization system protein ParE
MAAQQVAEQAAYYRRKADTALANRWKAAVNDVALSLSFSPMRGSLCSPELKRIPELRRLPIRGFPNHLLYYRFLEDQRRVIVVAVLHGARDPNIVRGLDE